MTIKSATGVNLTNANDYLIGEMMTRYGISRRNACRLVGEALVRTCVVEEIMATADALIVVSSTRKGGELDV